MLPSFLSVRPERTWTPACHTGKVVNGSRSPEGDRVSTRAERLALPVWQVGVRSLCLGRRTQEGRQLRDPHDEAVVAVDDRDLCTTHVVRVSQARGAQESAMGQRRRGAIARYALWGKASSRCPRHCANAHIGPTTCIRGAVRRWRPQSPEWCPQHPAAGWGRSPRPELRAGKVVKSSRSGDQRP